jgi:hypothetical protein
MTKLLIALTISAAALIATAIIGTLIGIVVTGCCCAVLVLVISYNANEELHLEKGYHRPGWYKDGGRSGRGEGG